LQAVPLLYVFFSLAAFGLVLDLRVGNSRLAAAPQLWLVLAFFMWALITMLASAPGAMAQHALELSVCLALYAVIAHGVQSFRALHAVAALLLGLVLLVAFVG